jgi:hypothetical protein
MTSQFELVKLEFSNLYPGLNALQPLGREGPLELRVTQKTSEIEPRRELALWTSLGVAS